MSYTRKQQDNKKGKVNNLVAKNDFNRGGVHGKSNKANRSNFKQNINQIDPWNEDEFDFLESEYS